MDPPKWVNVKLTDTLARKVEDYLASPSNRYGLRNKTEAISQALREFLNREMRTALVESCEKCGAEIAYVPDAATDGALLRSVGHEPSCPRNLASKAKPARAKNPAR